MAKLRVKLTYPEHLVTRPIVHHLGARYHLVTNIRRADVTEDRGWVELELDGAADDIERGLDDVRTLGIRVDLVGGDVVEG